MWAEGRENGGEKGQSPGESRERQKERGSDVETLTVRKDQPGVGGHKRRDPSRGSQKAGHREGRGEPGRAALHVETLSARPRAKPQRLLVW